MTTPPATDAWVDRPTNPDPFAALPKAELHVHLEASMRDATAVELADRHGPRLPRRGPFTGLGEFVGEYEVARDLIGSLTDLRRVALELVEDAAAQGVVWTEVHLIPPTYAGRLGADEAVLEAVLDGLAAAPSGTAAAVILGINRGLPLQAGQRCVDLAIKYAGRGVVGLGLAGDEANHPAEKFVGLFDQARDAGLRALPHAGEAAGPASVHACVEALGAQRICHGVRAIEDSAVVDLLVQNNVCLDVCPSSNVSLRVSRSIEEHPLPLLMAAGVPVTLNSDGALFSRATINDEYRSAQRTFALEWDALAQIARTSLMFSSCPQDRRAEALHRIDAWRPTPTRS